MKLDFNLNLYDFLGYIIPGILTAWAAQVLIVDVLRLPVGLTFGGSATETAFFVVASFIVGHLVQGVAELLEPVLLNPRVKTGDGWRRMFPSERFRLEDDLHFSKDFKEAFEQKAATLFRLPVGAREAFDLAYAYIITHGYGAHTELFNAIYGMSRGLLLATLLGAGVYIIQVVDAVTIHDNAEVAKEAAVFAILLCVGSVLAFSRARRFSRRFADSVYRAFLAVPGPES